ncbi:DNA-binding transcriptional regulator [Fructobacillus fructosus]|uniref:helix-turn-helix domain-containing protein n=1 Tax=Fructobacillus fructosus TaxID=1631 RepID=UPI002D818E79|nr:DNA-binding transcriptional regulator [Fructobacillus fructosus]
MNRIKELRKKQHKTLREVAEAVGTSNQNISNWERGKSEPKLSTWRKLMEYFDVSFEYLVGWTDER